MLCSASASATAVSGCGCWSWNATPLDPGGRQCSGTTGTRSPVFIDAASYAKPRELGGLPGEEIRNLIKEVTGSTGAVLSSTDVEDIADHAARIDPAGRPLFAVIAALDWLDGNGMSAGRDPVLRRLLKRLDAQMAERLAGSALAPESARNLRTFATTLGGISADEYHRILDHLEPPPGLLPGAFDDYQLVSLDDLVDGVRPDILGELYVLDRLAGGAAEHHAAVTLLRLGWQADPDAYHAFVERTVVDHREREHVAELLDVGDWRRVAGGVRAAGRGYGAAPGAQRSSCA
jgi:hypothetical protein